MEREPTHIRTSPDPELSEIARDGTPVLRIDRPPVIPRVTWTRQLRLERISHDRLRNYLDLPEREDIPSPEILLSIFSHRYMVDHGKPNYSKEAYHAKLVQFFSWRRVSHILLFTQQGRTGDWIRNDLQSNLIRTGGYQHVGLWRYHIGWLKGRILECYHEKDLPLDRWTLLLEYRIPLEEILKLPIRDPREQTVEELWPVR